MKGASVAVVVAHPDDEVLAFGGTIIRHAQRGNHVHILALATGVTSRPSAGLPDGPVAALRVEARESASVLGATSIRFGEFPDNRMDSVALLEVVQAVEKFLDEVDAEFVYGHHMGDLNIDHVICARAVLTACRPLPRRPARKLYAGEVLSSTEYAAEDRFQPNTYVDIAAVLDTKCRALRCYKSELRDWPHPRSTAAVSNLARVRGAEVGLEAAEALRLIRELVR